MPDAGPTLVRRVLGPLVRWARAHNRAGIAVIGALPGRATDAWASPLALPLPVALGVADPRQADLLVVVGRISHKLAPFVVRAHAGMARPAAVLVVDLEPPQPASPRWYPTVVDIAAILPVNVIVRGCPPAPGTLARALSMLERAEHEAAPREGAR